MPLASGWCGRTLISTLWVACVRCMMCVPCAMYYGGGACVVHTLGDGWSRFSQWGKVVAKRCDGTVISFQNRKLSAERRPKFRAHTDISNVDSWNGSS